MTLAQAVKKLGGPSKAAVLAGVPRTSIIYWMRPKAKPPKWRQADIARICALAEQEAA